MPTMSDVAKRANVALSTVSYAINGTRPISDETRKRIFAAMEELGYRPNALARGLASKRSRILALLFSAPERGLGITELEFVTSAADAARENDYHLVLWSSEIHDPNELRELIQEGLVDGVVAMEVHLNDERINLLREINFPFSMIGRCEDTSGIGYVDIDFQQTLQEAVGHLAGFGHSRIAFINHSQMEYDAKYGPAVRAQARFEEAARAANVRGYSRFCKAAPLAGYEAMISLLAEDPQITGLISMNERVIPGIMQAIAEKEWAVPDDFSLVSIISSARSAEMVMPALTTLEPQSAQMGRLGVELLIQQLEGKVEEVTQILLPCKLVVRGSTGRCQRNTAAAGA